MMLLWSWVAKFILVMRAELCSGCLMISRTPRIISPTWPAHQEAVSAGEETSTRPSPSDWRLTCEAGSMLSLRRDADQTWPGDQPRDPWRRAATLWAMLWGLRCTLSLDLCTTCCCRNLPTTTRMLSASTPRLGETHSLHSLTPLIVKMTLSTWSASVVTIFWCQPPTTARAPSLWCLWCCLLFSPPTLQIKHLQIQWPWWRLIVRWILAILIFKH